MHRPQLIIPVALLALACGLVATRPVQGRLTQGGGQAPPPVAYSLGVDLQIPGHTIWVSQPLDARGYHSVTVNLTTSMNRMQLQGLRILGRNTPGEAWCEISSKRTAVFGSQQSALGQPQRGVSVVFEGLHVPEIAVEAYAPAGRQVAYQQWEPAGPFSVSAYLE